MILATVRVDRNRISAAGRRITTAASSAARIAMVIARDTATKYYAADDSNDVADPDSATAITGVACRCRSTDTIRQRAADAAIRRVHPTEAARLMFPPRLSRWPERTRCSPREPSSPTPRSRRKAAKRDRGAACDAAPSGLPDPSCSREAALEATVRRWKRRFERRILTARARARRKCSPSRDPLRARRCRRQADRYPCTQPPPVRDRQSHKTIYPYVLPCGPRRIFVPFNPRTVSPPWDPVLPR